MRFLLLMLSLVTAVAAAVPPELESALARFRPEPPKGWSFTQTTTGEGQTTVERCNAAKPEFERWTLTEKDGRPPTPAETTRYQEHRSRRSRGGTAPKLTDQFDLTSLELISETAEQATYRCRLHRADPGDKTADHLRATFVLHRPSGTITSVVLSNPAPFSPAVAVRIQEMHTELTYSLPDDARPSLPLRVATRVRGTAFWFKSLNAGMEVVYSDYAWAGRR